MELLNRASYQLCVKNPFYGIFLAELNKAYAERIPTACVSKADNSSNIQLLVNRKFFEGLTEGQRISLYIHEILHVMFGHLWLMPNYSDKKIYNYATDSVINQIIRKSFDELPNWIVPECFPDLNLKLDEGTEYYYHEMMKAKEKKQKEGSSGDKKFDQLMDRDEDIHEDWDSVTEGMSDVEKEIFTKKVEEAIKNAAEQSPGNVPSQFKDLVEKLMNPKKPVVDWKKLLRQFIGSTISSEQYLTRKRPNFRFPDSPANKNKYKTNIIVSIDSSGSISDEQYEEFFGEVFHAHKAGTKIRIHLWDTTVHMEFDFDGKAVLKRCCQGGTDASDSIRKANEKRGKYDALILLSDGMIPAPIKSNLPTLWIITRDGSLSFEHNGKKIRM